MAERKKTRAEYMKEVDEVLRNGRFRSYDEIKAEILAEVWTLRNRVFILRFSFFRKFHEPIGSQ